jgi:hypothetical protein
MIVRVARFRSLSVDDRDWITEALRNVPGVRSVYHASRPDTPGYISISVFDDEGAMQSGQDAIAQRRVELGKESLGPDEVEVYWVDHYVENKQTP